MQSYNAILPSIFEKIADGLPKFMVDPSLILMMALIFIIPSAVTIICSKIIYKKYRRLPCPIGANQIELLEAYARKHSDLTFKYVEYDEERGSIFMDNFNLKKKILYLNHDILYECSLVSLTVGIYFVAELANNSYMRMRILKMLDTLKMHMVMFSYFVTILIGVCTIFDRTAALLFGIPAFVLWLAFTIAAIQIICQYDISTKSMEAAEKVSEQARANEDVVEVDTNKTCQLILYMLYRPISRLLIAPVIYNMERSFDSRIALTDNTDGRG